MNAEATVQSSKSHQHRGSNQIPGQWQPNIGKTDRYIRLVSGLLLMGSSMSSRNSNFTSRALLAIGAMKTAEGILGWCPVMELFGIQDTKGVIESQASSGGQNKADRSSQDHGGHGDDGGHGDHGTQGEHDGHNKQAGTDEPMQAEDRSAAEHKEPSGHQGPESESWHQMADSKDKSERDEVVAAMNTSFQ